MTKCKCNFLMKNDGKGFWAGGCRQTGEQESET